MQMVSLKLVTVIAEGFLEERIIREILQLGAHGYTVSPARGEGSRGVRASEWEGESARIETIVSSDVADRIIAYLVEHYFEHYAVVAYMQNVDVVRGAKYL